MSPGPSLVSPGFSLVPRSFPTASRSRPAAPGHTRPAEAGGAGVRGVPGPSWPLPAGAPH